MKKWILLFAVLFAGVLLGVLLFGHLNKVTIAPILSSMMVDGFIIIITIIFLGILSCESHTVEESIGLDALDKGQVVRLRGFHTVSGTTFVMVEITPEEIVLLELSDKECDPKSLKIGHWYRSMSDESSDSDSKFVPIPIGENA